MLPFSLGKPVRPDWAKHLTAILAAINPDVLT